MAKCFPHQSSLLGIASAIPVQDCLGDHRTPHPRRCSVTRPCSTRCCWCGCRAGHALDRYFSSGRQEPVTHCHAIVRLQQPSYRQLPRTAAAGSSPSPRHTDKRQYLFKITRMHCKCLVWCELWPEQGSPQTPPPPTQSYMSLALASPGTDLGQFQFSPPCCAEGRQQ